jgi:hypothetical protein
MIQTITNECSVWRYVSKSRTNARSGRVLNLRPPQRVMIVVMTIERRVAGD